MATNTGGRHLLTEKDFVEVVDAEGNELPSVPKHWGEDDLAPGASFKKRARASSGSGSGSPGSGGQPSANTDAEPAGNASRDDWAAWATRVKGATEADLVDADGKPLGRDEIRAKYGTPSGS